MKMTSQFDKNLGVNIRYYSKHQHQLKLTFENHNNHLA